MARAAGKRKKRRRSRSRSSSVSDQVITISDFFGEPQTANAIGFAELTAGVALPSVLWSALNPGYAGLKSAARKPFDRGNASQGLWIGLGLTAAVTAGLYYFVRRPSTAIIAGATSLILFGIGMSAINSVELESISDSRQPALKPTTMAPAPKPAPVSVEV